MERTSRGWWAVGALVALTCVMMLWQGVSTSLTPAPAETSDVTSEPVEQQEGAPPPSSTDSAGKTEIVVHVAGAVKNPGVVRLPGGSRVDDAVKAAGGFSPQADPDAVNLAQPLEDGVQVYVPRRDESMKVSRRTGMVEPASAPENGKRPSGKVNINTATAEELESLPGIGPVTARAIVDYRRQVGGFHSVDNLLDVRGIGEKRLEQIRSYVTVR